MSGGSLKSENTISSPAMITGSNLSFGASVIYEVSAQQNNQYLALKKAKNFGLFNRTIAAADSEFNWTWDNRSAVASANENNAVANASRWTASTAITDWFAGPYTAARRYKNFTFSPKSILTPKVLIARMANNASTAYTGCGIQITQSDDDATFLRYQVGFGAAAAKIISYLGTAPQETACSSGNLTDGIWLRMTFCNGTVLLDYNLTVESTPPTTGWVRDRSVSFAFDMTKTYQIGMIQIVNVEDSGLVSDFLYYDDSDLFAESSDDAQNPTWAAQGYDTSNTAIQLLTDYDLGSTAPTINQTVLRLFLADIQNKRFGDAASWTFSVKQSATVGATAGSYATASSVTVEGSGRYCSVWAKCSSDGSQPGSLLLPLLVPIIAT